MGDEDELYVVESQDAWYWPHHGLQRNKYDDWVKYANSAGFNVAILPIRKELSDHMNENQKQIWDFFHKVEGMPYGYHNFLFGWIDTVNHSYPQPLDPEFVWTIFSLFEKMGLTFADVMIKEAMNHRIGNFGPDFKTLDEVAMEAIENHQMSIRDLFATVEEDDIMY